MRIKSSFHDYYDGVQIYGQDRSLLYLRTPKEVKCAKYPFATFWEPSAHPMSVEVLMIGFCGKLYPAVRVKDTPLSL